MKLKELECVRIEKRGNFVITAKERIAIARAKRARLEKMRDKFLILSEDIGIKATDRLKALSMAYEIEKELNANKF